jgi:2-dehydropantoate 2-reductase
LGGAVKVAVFGGGAVGLGLSSCLLASGASLHVHVRDPASRDALRRDGLVRSGLFGEYRARPGSFGVSTDPAALADSAPDWILVCTKQTARQAVLRTLGELWTKLASPGVVLCWNGWGSAEHFATRLPRERIFNATVTTGFALRARTRVEITVHGDRIHVGSLFGVGPQELTPLCADISAGGIPCA